MTQKLGAAGARNYLCTHESKSPMFQQTESVLANFFIAGINYKKTDASIRGQFAVNNDQYTNILQIAPQYGISECFILSTCNRTEIYGFAESVSQLVHILCTQTVGSEETFNQLSYSFRGQKAVEHLYEVGAGLESQILGDYEIIGQIKMAIKVSKNNGFMGSFIERLVNSVLQSTKVIKNQTALSGGTVSVSFAAVQYIKKHVTNICDKKVLLLGVGKIGRNTCKNLVDYLGATHLTLINRSKEKATELARELGLHCAAFEDLEQYIQNSDIILVATNADQPVILQKHLKNAGQKLVIDLSIPYNVDIEAAELSNVQLVNVDELSKLKDETLQKREAEVPKAKEIIAEHMADFIEWNELRKNAPVLRAVKQKLFDMHNCQMFLSSNDMITKITDVSPASITKQMSVTSPASSPKVTINQFAIHRVIKNLAVKMRTQRQPGCSYIEAINDFITTHRN